MVQAIMDGTRKRELPLALSLELELELSLALVVALVVALLLELLLSTVQVVTPSTLFVVDCWGLGAKYQYVPGMNDGRCWGLCAVVSPALENQPNKPNFIHNICALFARFVPCLSSGR